MKLILKQTILDKMMKEHADAQRAGREPECFVLTQQEYAEFRADCRFNWYDSRASYMYMKTADKISDLSFVRREFKLNPRYRYGRYAGRGDTLIVASDITFMGVHVFSVPDEFMPE